MRFCQTSLIAILIFLCLGSNQLLAQNIPNQSIYFKTIPPFGTDIPDWVSLMYSENPNVWEVDRLYHLFYKENEFLKTTHTQNYKFWRNHLNENYLIDEQGFIRIKSNEEIRKDQERTLEVFNWSNNTMSSMSTWTPVGPMTTKATDGQPNVSWQTNVYTFDQSISNPNRLYAGTETGAMFMSTNKGLNWINIGASISDGAIQSVSVDPNNELIAYFGTGNNIWKTSNGGLTFTSVYYQNNLQPRDFYINPSNSSIVLTVTNVGVFRTTNGGSSWTQLYSEDGWDLEGKPGSPNTVYLLMSKSSEQLIKFYRSTNAGASFTEYDTGWYAGSAAGINNTNTGARMAVTAADPERIYVALLGNDVSYDQDNNWIGVYKSTNSGNSWTLPVGEVGGPYDSNHFCLSSFNPTSTGYDQGYYNLGIAVSATNADELLVGCLNLFKSEDGATTYTQWGGYGGGPGWQHPDIQELEINGNDVWVASDGGLNYYTADFSSHESRINGINGSSYWGFDSGWNEDILVGGRYHNGNAAHIESYASGQFLRLGGAESPTGYVNKGENRKVWHSDIGGDLVPSDIDDPVSSIGNLGLYPNESYFNENKSDLKTYPYCYNYFLLGKDNTLWKSENGGASFYSLYTFGAVDEPLVGIEISRSNPDVIYVGQKVSGSTKLWKTINGGVTWTSSTVPGAVGGGMFLSLSPTNENELWVAHSKNSSSNKVLKTTDGGLTWNDLTTNTLNGLYSEDILVQGGTNGGVYYSTNNGMYYKNNTHADWQLYNAGLPANFGVMELRPFYRDSKLRAASNRGIWEVEFYESSTPVAQPTVDKLVSNCPLDTFYFEDFSMLDHANANWSWSFSPTPQFISESNVRNPKVVFGNTGSYSYSLTVTNSNGTDTKSYTDFIQINGNECGVDTIPGTAMTCFASGDYCQTPDLQIGATNTMTITAWIKPDGIQRDYAGIAINDGADVAGFNFRGGNNTLGYHWPGGAWWWDSGLIAPAGEWSHVAFVVDPTGVTIYLNGVPAKHNFTAGAVDITAMKFGSYRAWADRFYVGLMDEVCIWNRALSQTEIREHRHLTHYVSTDPTIHAYFQFNETINTIYDKIGGRHASFTGNATRVNSTAPVGGGSVARQTITSSGIYSFGNTGIELNFPSTGTYPNGELVGFHLNVAPDERPVASTLPQHGYYIINNYGTNATFSELISISLGAMELSNVEAQNLSNLSLCKRDSNEDGNTWTTGIDIADAVVSGNSGSILFDNGNSVTNFSQFIVAKEDCPDTLLVNVQPIIGDTLQAAMVVMSNGQAFSGANVVFHAGNHIDLNEGFTVDSGADFLAEIAGCNSTTMLINNENSAKSKVLTNVSIDVEKENNLLSYHIDEEGIYSLHIKSRNQTSTLFSKRSVTNGQHQLALASDQFPTGLYVLILEKEGKVIAKELLRF